MTDMLRHEMERRIGELASTGVDVVIIGAGINGAGLFRDLCEQGIDCLIIERNDFGSGTSAAPSRLIHGGIKYLETGEFRLVAQSTLERNLLLKNAPHLVEPLPTMIPVFSWTRGVAAALRTLVGSTTAPRSRGAVLVKIGMWLYDFYGSRAQVMPRHRVMSRSVALAEMPGLTPSIVGAGLYYDAKISAPERLVLELVKDGIRSHSRAAAINATTLVDAGHGVLTFEREDGARFTIRPKVVINAAGPWIDQANRMLGEATALIGGTKGSHILLRHDELLKRLKGRMIYFEADDGRICLVFEYMGRALVGSTDVKAADPDDVRCEDWEIDYFLDSLRGLLPGLSFDRSQIVYTYSGIRPLPRSDASNPGLISRDHSAPVLEVTTDRPFPIISLVGGKWTTFRGFAEEVAETVLTRLGRKRRVSTEALAIGGGRNFPQSPEDRRRWLEDASARTGADAARLDILLSRYGTVARDIAAHEMTVARNGPLPGSPDHTRGEIDWILRHELVEHLSDLTLRRTMLAIRGLLTDADLAAMAAIAAEVLGWDAERRQREIEATKLLLSRDHGLTL